MAFLEGANLPTWVYILGAVLLALGTFWGKIEKSFNTWILNRHKHKLEDFERCKEELKKVRMSNERLKKNETILKIIVENQIQISKEMVRQFPDKLSVLKPHIDRDWETNFF